MVAALSDKWVEGVEEGNNDTFIGVDHSIGTQHHGAFNRYSSAHECCLAKHAP